MLYADWDEIRPRAVRELRDADAAIVTSYCPDGVAATEIVLDAPGLHVFYDLDTPVTLARLASGERIEAIGPRGLASFDLVLSYTGGGALTALRERLGARACRAALRQRRSCPLSSGRACRPVRARRCPISGPMPTTGKTNSTRCCWSRRGAGRDGGS